MIFDDILDPSSAAAIAENAVDRALDALTLALAARDVAAGSAKTAADSLAAVNALIRSLGVSYRWAGTALQLLQPDGSYGPAADLRGPIGRTGQVPILQVGIKTVGDLAFEIDNADPLYPVVNVTIPPGDHGWTPVLATVSQGERRVQQIVDWTGGTGAKPATGLYMGPNGPTNNVLAATDLRGAPGATGTSGANFLAASTSAVAVTLGTVEVVLTPSTAQGFATCQYMALVSQSDPRNAMAGLLQSYDPTLRTLAIAVLQSSGSGTHADWIVTPSQVLTIPTFIDDGFYDSPQQSASSQTVSYVAVSPSASADDDGTF